MVYDVTDQESFNNVKQWLQVIQRREERGREGVTASLLPGYNSSLSGWLDSHHQSISINDQSDGELKKRRMCVPFIEILIAGN